MLNLIGRTKELFLEDISNRKETLNETITNSRFLVLGGAGSIGQAVVKELFKRKPEALHVVDISENNLVELVRDIRSTFGYISGDFRTLAIDIGSVEYDAFFEADGKYDYILNLSALKHVRSEENAYTLMRMIEVNIFNTSKTIEQAAAKGVKKYFCVSTDKAANPVNMMGASKYIMEMFVHRGSAQIPVSMARFANVAFSDGSLLHGFDQRLSKKQPIVAPTDIKRYFVTPKEGAELCLMSTIFGDNRDIFFPKPSEELKLTTFSEIAIKYLEKRNLKAYQCKTEEEARKFALQLPHNSLWPVLFTKSDTTGEKKFEEFFTQNETLDMSTFINLGVIKNVEKFNSDLLTHFENRIAALRSQGKWNKEQLVHLFHEMIPEFGYLEKGKYLNSKM